MTLLGKQFFPCPLCLNPLDVRQSKKRKPYVCCDVCGLQLFVRNDTGIRKLQYLIAGDEKRDVWTRMAELRARYQKTCPDCGSQFWITNESITTNWINGKVLGFRCPESGCNGVVEA
jgi:hypothetical protein